MDKSKKGMEMMYLIAAVALLLIFLAVMTTFYVGNYRKLFGGFDDQVQKSDDNDGDNVANYADKCPCQPGLIENEGCQKNKDEGRDCLENENA